MKKINLAMPLTTISGKPVVDQDTGKPLMLSEIVGNVVYMAQPRGDAIHQADLARTLHRSTGEIAIEDADFKLIQDIVHESSLNCAARSAAEQCFRDAQS